MTLTKLRSLAWLLALLLQLAVLGLGRGVVLCVAPSGHVQLEVSGGSCCDERSPTPAGGVELAQPAGDPDCGPCSDLEIPVDRRTARILDVRFDEFSASAPALLAVVPRADFELAVNSAWGERGHAPPHLVHLRSVVLRC